MKLRAPRSRHLSGALLIALLACGPSVPKLEQDVTTTEGMTDAVPTTSSFVDMGRSSTSGTSSMQPMSTAGADTTCDDACDEVSSSGDGVDKLDMGRQSCNPQSQDCPPGQKCAPHAFGPGEFWSAASCFPVMENPAQVGEPCVIQGLITSGIDNCDVGAMCWEGDHNGRGEFRCAALCSGPLHDPVCPPGSFCSLFSELLAVCEVPVCDPLVQDCPQADEVCVPNIFLWDDWCRPDESGAGGKVDDPCSASNECDEGLVCIGSNASMNCDPDAAGCCQPFCEIGVDSCAGPGQECLLTFNNTSKNVGVCRLP